MSCQCLGRCVNSAPQTRRDEMRIKEGTTGTRKRKRRQEKAKGGQPTQQTPWTRLRRLEKERGKGKAGGHTAITSEGEGTTGDEPGYTPTPEDLHLREVCGDWVYVNPGTHLDGGILDNSAGRAWWRDLAVMPTRRYDMLSGRVQQRFVGTLGSELKGVRERL